MQPRLEHFQCYGVRRARVRRRAVRIEDQFGARNTRIRARAELCNPTRKRQEPFVNRRAHLQCYATPGSRINRRVAVQNQFGSQRLWVLRPIRLCVPTQKRKQRGKFRPIPNAQRIDPFQCYGVRALTPLRALRRVRRVLLRDQFGRRVVRVGRAVRLCAPARKNQEAVIQHPVRHLVCYRLALKPRRAKIRRPFVIRNQFERRRLRTVRRNLVCVPSNKLVLS